MWSKIRNASLLTHINKYRLQSSSKYIYNLCKYLIMFSNLFHLIIWKYFFNEIRILTLSIFQNGEYNTYLYILNFISEWYFYYTDILNVTKSFNNGFLSKTSVLQWYKVFKEGSEFVIQESRSGALRIHFDLSSPVDQMKKLGFINQLLTIGGIN